MYSTQLAMKISGWLGLINSLAPLLANLCEI